MVGSDDGEMTHQFMARGEVSDGDRSVGSSAGRAGRGSGSFAMEGYVQRDLLVLVYMVKQITLSISLQ